MPRLRDFDSLAGGIASGLISGEELEIKQREQTRLEAGEKRLRASQGLEYLKTLPDVGKQDPAVGGPMLDAWLQGAASLGLDVSELKANRSEFLSTPGAAGLFAKIAAGRGTIEDEGKLGQLNRELLELALKQRAETREVTLGKAAPGKFGFEGAAAIERAGAEAGIPAGETAKVVESRARTESLLRPPVGETAKIAFQRQALQALSLLRQKKPLPSELAMFESLKDEALARIAEGRDPRLLEALMAGFVGQAIGAETPSAVRPTEQPATSPKDLPPADKHSGRSLTYKDGSRWRSDGKQWVPVK